MKKTILIVLAALFPLITIGQEKPDLDHLKTTIGILENDIKELDIAINQAYYDAYIDQMERANRTIMVFAYKGFDVQELYANVPHIGDLHKVFAEADNDLQEILKKEKRYRKARKIQVNSANKEKREKAGEMLSSVYRKLQYNSSEYREIQKRRTQALRDQNTAILRYLLEDYHSRGMILPTSPIISGEDINAIRSNNPHIFTMEVDRDAMNSTLRSIQYRLIRNKYENNNSSLIH